MHIYSDNIKANDAIDLGGDAQVQELGEREKGEGRNDAIMSY